MPALNAANKLKHLLLKKDVTIRVKIKQIHFYLDADKEHAE